MANCRYCGTDCPENGEHDRFFDCVLYTERKQKQPTNADKIRSMSDEELAVFFAKVDAALYRADLYVIAYRGEKVNENLDWLRQPAKEEAE